MAEDGREVLAELVRKTLAGDADAEAELAAWCRPRLVRQLRRLTGNEAAAADLTQDALLIGIVRLRRVPLADPSGVGAFLRGIAVKLMLNERRKTRRRRTGNAISPAIPDDAPGPLDAILARERRQLLTRAIDGLRAARDRDLVRRFYLDAEPKESIARAHGLDALQFDRVLFRARRRLRELIARISS
jgi:RNA polymerase sigma factor (sigma-70 family)